MVCHLHQSYYLHAVTAQHPDHVTWSLLALQAGHRQLAQQVPSSLELECELLCTAYCHACDVDCGVAGFQFLATVPRSKMKAMPAGCSSSMMHAYYCFRRSK